MQRQDQPLKRKRTADDKVEEVDEDGEEGTAVPDAAAKDPATTLSLRELQLCGIESIYDHEHYKKLFGDSPNRVSSLDVKILSTRLETAVWDSLSALACVCSL